MDLSKIQADIEQAIIEHDMEQYCTFDEYFVTHTDTGLKYNLRVYLYVIKLTTDMLHMLKDMTKEHRRGTDLYLITYHLDKPVQAKDYIEVGIEVEVMRELFNTKKLVDDFTALMLGYYAKVLDIKRKCGQ